MIAPLPDFGLLTGEDVAVLTRSVEYDAHMEEVETWESETVGNVLVHPGSTSDVRDSSRPDGTRAAFTLGFPKSYTGSLRGCRVSVRGEVFAVIGDPRPASPDNIPGRWNRNVEVEAVCG